MLKQAIPIIALLAMYACGKSQTSVVEPASSSETADQAAETRKRARQRAAETFSRLESETSKAPSGWKATSTQPEISSRPTSTTETQSSQSTTTFSRELPEGWVEVTAKIPVLNITPGEAQQKALERARRNAVEKALGVEIRAQEQSFRSDTVDEFRHSFTSLVQANYYGRIVKEEAPDVKFNTEWVSGKSFVFCHLTLRVKVAKEAGRPDPSFQVNLVLNNQTFREGEEIKLSITPTQDCYITVLNILSDHTVLTLRPSDGQTQFVKGRQEFTLPTETERQHGVRFRLGLLPGKTEDTEGVLVVATKADVPFLPKESEAFNPEIPAFSGKMVIPTYKTVLQELNQWLVNIPLDGRASDYEMYEIRQN